MIKTLSQLNGSVLRAPRAIPVSAKELASVVSARILKADEVSPDCEALEFYGLNQAVAHIQGMFTPNEALPPWAAAIVDSYASTMSKQYHRLLHYVFIITSREWRHMHNLKAVAEAMPEGPPPGMVSLHPHIKDSTEAAYLQKWLEKVPDIPISDYAKFIEHSFDTGKWSSSYGGKPWGAITRTLRRHVAGETSGEVFIDTAYTLAHNTGPMFNKGMLYLCQSGEFISVLDVQRSGQVVEGLLSGELPAHKVQGVHSALSLMQSETKAFGSYIDWFKVESLGSVKKYPSQKAKQAALYGNPAQTVILSTGKAAKVKGSFEWMPGSVVDIIERVS